MGAINEILPKATGVGKVDPNSDGTGEIFNSYEGDRYPNVASGDYSHAEGNGTTASSMNSHAEGNGTNATGYASHAEGNDTTAKGNSSHAEGASTNAEGWYSHAEGSQTSATGEASHAEGKETTASGLYSHAEGRATNATGGYSHAEGLGATATSDFSHAEGYRTSAGRGVASHAEGYCTQTFSPGEHAEGYYNKSYESTDNSVRVRHSVGIGSANADRKNAHEIKFNGDHYIYGVGNFDGTNSADAQTLQEVINSKQETITPGTGLEFEGNTLNVTLDTTVFKVVSALPDSPAAGDENKIHLVPAESTGTNNAYTEYVWVNSAWEILGEYTSEIDLTPYLKAADAESTYLKITNAESEYATKTELAGKQNSTDDTLETTSKNIVGAINEILPKATGVGRIDPNYERTGEIFNSYEGSRANVASGQFSHAEGYNTQAIGNHSHAEGRFTKATGDRSHAEGEYVIALGKYSHAEGYNTIASGTESHTEGYLTQAFSQGEHAEGTYNKSYDSEDSSIRVIHSVGIGSSTSDRKNAHEIKFNGDQYVYGLGNYDGTNYNSRGVQTLQEVINSKQETITPGTGLEFEGNTLNVTLDTTVFKVVSVLPDSPAQGDENKIHLVAAESTGTNNAYTEYVWVNSAWEILGEYTSEIDLTPYLKTVDAQATYAAKTELTAHTSNSENPHNVTAAQVGLGNVDNTSDADKPVSTATQQALNLKQNVNDDSLQTTSKTVAGAINELASKPSGVGKVDPNSDGTGEIFNICEGQHANVASGVYSHAEGYNTTASGVASHAEGYTNKASGIHSHAEGSHTNATGYASHSEGGYTKALNDYEHVEGKYNLSNTGGTEDLQTRHSVGIGTSSSDRKNAHEIMANGDHYIYGLGGYDGTNATDISVKTLQRIIEEILINTQQPVIDYSAPDSAFTGTTLINSVGISAVNVWNVENYSRTDIFLLNSSGTTTDKIRYDVVRDTQYQDFQTAHEGDNIQFDEIIQLSTIVTNSFAVSDLFIYHAKINDEPAAKYYLVDIVMTE